MKRHDDRRNRDEHDDPAGDLRLGSPRREESILDYDDDDDDEEGTLFLHVHHRVHDGDDGDAKRAHEHGAPSSLLFHRSVHRNTRWNTHATLP